MTSTRREVLALSASVFATAGCLGGDDSGGDTDDDSEATNVADWQRVDGTTLSSSFPMELSEPDSEISLVEVHWHREQGHWHRMPLGVPLSQWRTVVMRVQNRNLEPISLGEDAQHRVEIGRTTETAADLVELSVAGDHVDIYGNAEGTGELVFQLLSGDTVVWTSPGLTIEVSSNGSNS